MTTGLWCDWDEERRRRSTEVHYRHGRPRLRIMLSLVGRTRGHANRNVETRRNAPHGRTLRASRCEDYDNIREAGIQERARTAKLDRHRRATLKRNVSIPDVVVPRELYRNCILRDPGIRERIATLVSIGSFFSIPFSRTGYSPSVRQ